MIKNEKQFRIAKAQTRRFGEALAELARQERPSNITPGLWQAQHDAAESQLRELQEQIHAYESLGRASVRNSSFRAVEDLP